MEGLYRAIFEHADEMIVFVDPAGTVAAVNPRIESLLGCTPAEIMGTEFAQLYGPIFDRLLDRTPLFEAVAAGAPSEIGRRVEIPFRHRDGHTIWTEAAVTAIRDGARLRGYLGIFHDVTGRKLAEEALREGEARYRDLFENAREAFILVDCEGKITHANAFVEEYGFKKEDLIGRALFDFVAWDHAARAAADFAALLGGTPVQGEMEVVAPRGVFSVEYRDNPVRQGDRIVGIQIILTDITERRRSEAALNVSRRVLKISNRHVLREPALEEVVREVREFTGCEAVGIRLLDECGDIPYQAYVGFSREFYERESPLSIHSDQCMCINVIKGETNPALSFYTPDGSFFMNGTTRFLATVSEQEKGRTRNVCNQEGYESVALIPIRANADILGLIHIADRRENMVPLRLVQTLENIAISFGVAVQRILAEEALRISEGLHRFLFENMLKGFAYCRMLFHEGRPQDFIYLAVNKAFETQTGLKDVVGKKVSEVIPGIRESDRELLEIYGRVALTGRPEAFETYVDALGMWFSTSVYSPQKGHFVAVFDVITELKRAERRLLDHQKRLRELATRLTLAEEQERRRIAVGVHDQIGQRMALVKLALQSLRASTCETYTSLTLDEVCEDIDKVVDDAHSLTFELSNPVLYEAGFVDAVESWLVQQIHDRHGLQYTFEADKHVVPVDKDTGIVLFQSVRELLANVVKHAKAGRVDVRIQTAGDEVWITVQDDGIGFEPSKIGMPDSKSGGYGLFSVRERLEYLGGSLKIDSGPGEGTCVCVAVPVQSRQPSRPKETSA